MPTPDYKPPQTNQMPDGIAEFFRRQPETNDALAYEVAELRREIAALRAELAPVPSLILTGREALDAFKRLAHAGT